jgi:WD40 repeat protein
MARLHLGRARTAFEKDQIGVGMLWVVESLKAATEAGDAFARRAALANLSAWRQHLVGVKQVFHHNNGVEKVAFSPDGKLIATASWDETARVWDLATRQPIGPPITHRDAVRSVAFSTDGHWLATASNDRTARIWDVANGRPIGPVMEHKGLVFCIAFSPDGRRVVTGCIDHGVRVWDALTACAEAESMSVWHCGWTAVSAYDHAPIAGSRAYIRPFSFVKPRLSPYDNDGLGWSTLTVQST